VTPQAMAYSSGVRPVGTPAPHPGEGTRAEPGPPPTAPIPLRPQAPPQVQQPGDTGGTGPVIGGEPPPLIHRTLPEDVVPPVGGGHSPRRYSPPPGEQMPRQQMPQIYERHRIFSYWYVPVAVLLAIVVAMGVIFGAERFFGGDGDPQPTASETPEQTTTTAAGETRTPGPSPTGDATPGETPVPTSTGSGIFSAGDTVEVFNTGDCLNVRTAPGINDPETGELNPAIICIADGTRVTVTDGPEEAGSFTWWKVETVLGEGWAVQDYLQRVQ
jgi:hypothetical protein